MIALLPIPSKLLSAPRRLRLLPASGASLSPPARTISSGTVTTERLRLPGSGVGLPVVPSAGRTCERDARGQGGLEPVEEGTLVVIDVETGDYEVDPSEAAATRWLLQRRPTPVIYGVRAA